MPQFEVTGSFQPGGEERSFTRQVEAENEDVAAEKIYTGLGSEHGLQRTQIEVEAVAEVEAA